MIGKAINRWREEGKTVSITIHDGIITGYAIGVDGEPHTVVAEDDKDLAVQLDNRLEDRMLKDCRYFISVVKR